MYTIWLVFPGGLIQSNPFGLPVGIVHQSRGEKSRITLIWVSLLIPGYHLPKIFLVAL